MENRYRRALRLQPNDRIPFVPAIYEHKAWFIGETPSVVCRDESLLVEACRAEYEAIGADAIVVGIDVYNVEAEAAGCTVTYYNGGNTSVPAIAPGSEPLGETADAGMLRIPDPSKEGRMPVMLKAASRVKSDLGVHTEVLGALTGPCSLAAALVGPSNLMMALADEPDRAHDALRRALAISLRYGAAYAALGIDAVVFDSQASPGIISPARFREFCLEPLQTLISGLKRSGMSHVPLVIGGNTDAIIDDYLATGADLILCDYPATAELFLQKCMTARRAYRRNISPAFIAAKTEDEIAEKAAKEIVCSGEYPGFILGTGVIAYGTETRKLRCIAERRDEGRKMREESIGH